MMQIFRNEAFGEIRVIEISNEPWFIAKDVCDALDLKNPTVTVERLDNDERSKFNLGRQGKTNIVNEYGLYNLVLSSRKNSAKKFKRWVTHEVLPSIRKNGAYMTPETIEKTLNDPDFIIKLATQLKEEQQKRIDAEHFTKQIACSTNSILVRELAKLASKNNVVIGEKRLYKKLRDWGLIFKNSTEPKQSYVDRGYFEVVEGVRENSKGTFVYKTTRVTGKGQEYIINRLVKESEEEYDKR